MVTVRNKFGFERDVGLSPNAVTSTWSDDRELYIGSCGPGQQSCKSDDTMSDSDRCWHRLSFVRGNRSASCEASTVRGWSKSGRSQVSSNGAMWGALFRKAARYTSRMKVQVASLRYSISWGGSQSRRVRPLPQNALFSKVFIRATDPAVTFKAQQSVLADRGNKLRVPEHPYPAPCFAVIPGALQSVDDLGCLEDIDLDSRYHFLLIPLSIFPDAQSEDGVAEDVLLCKIEERGCRDCRIIGGGEG